MKPHGICPRCHQLTDVAAPKASDRTQFLCTNCQELFETSDVERAVNVRWRLACEVTKCWLASYDKAFPVLWVSMTKTMEENGRTYMLSTFRVCFFVCRIER